MNNNTFEKHNMDLILIDVLLDIRDYLDVESTIYLSQTCTTLHNLLTEDYGTQYPKVKQSYFTFGDVSLWRDDKGHRLPDLSSNGAKVARSTPMISLSTKFLTRVHFPSLKRIEFRLAPTRLFMNSDEELKSAFIHLAMGLDEASELEEFYIDCGHLMKCESFFSNMLYEIFAKNLAKCKKLKRIKIFNHWKGQDGASYYSVGFLHSLIPMIEARVLTLEEVTLLIGNLPIVPPKSRAYRNAAADIFKALFKLQGMQELNLQLNLSSSPLLNLFIQAAESTVNTLGKIPCEDVIRKFMVTCVLYKKPATGPSPLPPLLSLSSCMALLKNSRKLHAFVIRIPPACWDTTCEKEFKGLLSNKPAMRHLGIYFHGYKSPNGECLEYICDYLQEREQCPDNLIHISGIDYETCNFNVEEALGRYYSNGGKKCLERDQKGMMFQARGHLMGWEN